MRGADDSTLAVRSSILGGMGDAAKVLEEALKLPASERGRVVSELIRSLDDESSDDPASVDAAWGTELQVRATRARAGESATDLDTALDRIENKRRGR
jgi:hypothetical protein